MSVLGVRNYEKESSRSDTPNTSGLSLYLHFGQISPQTVYHEAKHCKSPKFIRKLAWRDLSYWLLTLFPQMPTLPMRPHYRVSIFDLIPYLNTSEVKLYISVTHMREWRISFKFLETKVESKQGSLKSMAEGYDRLPFGGCSHERVVENRLDEQLHETCCCIFPDLVPSHSLDWRIQLVSGALKL